MRDGGPGRTRTFDQGIMSLLSAIAVPVADVHRDAQMPIYYGYAGSGMEKGTDPVTFGLMVTDNDGRRWT